MCLCIVQTHLYCTTFAFEGQNVENKNFSVKCCLLAFNIVALGPVVSLELFVSRAYVCMLLLITHIIFTHVRFFLRRRRKLHVSVERFLCFFNQFG